VTLSRPTEAPALYSQDGQGYNAIVHAHYFIGGCDWLVTEYDPTDDLAFGWACLGDPLNAELGYVSLAEMDSIRVGDYGQRVERETDWTPMPLTAAVDLILTRHGWTS
jgi:hypothetical protein